MILSLGLGEPQYIADNLLGLPHDSADLRWQAFLQCHARSVLSWQLCCYFANHDDGWCSLAEIAIELDCAAMPLLARLGEMYGAGLLEESVLCTGPRYCLTQDHPELRRPVLGIGLEWHGPGRDPL
jgi:hypothetical protein